LTEPAYVVTDPGAGTGDPAAGEICWTHTPCAEEFEYQASETAPLTESPARDV
jgi:hypothetical protein